MKYLEVDYKNPKVQKVIESMKKGDVLIYNGRRYFKDASSIDQTTGNETNIHYWGEFLEHTRNQAGEIISSNKVTRFVTVYMLFTWAYSKKRKLQVETKHGIIDIYNPNE